MKYPERGSYEKEGSSDFWWTANVIDGLREDKYDIYRIGITKEGKWLFVEDTDSIRDGSWVEGTVTAVISPDHGKKGIWKVTGNDVEVIPIDVAFPVLHGKFGEDGTIQEFRMWDVMF